MLGRRARIGKPSRRQVALDAGTKQGGYDDAYGGEGEDRPATSGGYVPEAPQVEHTLKSTNPEYVVNVAYVTALENCHPVG